MKGRSRLHHIQSVQLLLVGGCALILMGAAEEELCGYNKGVGVDSAAICLPANTALKKSSAGSDSKGMRIGAILVPSLPQAASPTVGNQAASRFRLAYDKPNGAGTDQPTACRGDVGNQARVARWMIGGAGRERTERQLATVAPQSPTTETSPIDAEDPSDKTPPETLPGGPHSQVNDNTLPTLETVTEAAAIATTNSDTQSGIDLTAASILRRQALQRGASDDQHTVSEPYRDIPIKQMGTYLQRAQNALSDAADMMENSKDSSLESSEKARFRNYMLNARDKAGMGLDMIREDEKREEQLGELSPFTGFLGMADANPMAKSAALAELFGTKLPTSAAATTTDALVNRLVMFNGLPADVQAQLKPKLKLAEMTTFKLPNGKVQTIPLLHNGYILGGGATAMDCSSFVSSILPSDVRKGRFTTLDFHTMWRYLKHGVFPSPPKYSAERAKLVKETATAFTAIDLYSGERLITGDLLVYRLLDEPIGHIFIVRSFNPSTLEVEVIEAAQSAGTIRERGFPLSAYPMNAPRRYIRPGLMALRLRPTNNRACTYREHGRLPAAKSPGQGVAQ